MIDIQKAMLDPTSVFAHPHDVVNHPGLTREQKIEILRRWAYDAKELETATDENMNSSATTEDHLAAILHALQELGAGLMKG
jgi:hypothetical protein